MEKVNVKVKVLNDDVILPKYETNGSAGMDIRIIEGVHINPGETVLTKTGMAFAIPEGFEFQIRPRSGLSLKTSLRLPNSPGTIDSDYRGELGIMLNNIGTKALYFKKGERVCQMVLNKVPQANLILVDDLDETDRGSGGFGSTGK